MHAVYNQTYKNGTGEHPDGPRKEMLPLQSFDKCANEIALPRGNAARPRSRFISEKDLVRRAISQSAWIRSEGGQDEGAITELDTPTGIVDIAYYRLRRDWRQHSAIGKIPSRWAYAFHRIPYRRQFSIADFATLTGTSHRRAKLALSEFSALDLCRQSINSETWLKVRQPILPLRVLVSVEAKLRDWKKALNQATRYSAYSDQGWVLLDGEAVRPALKHVADFERRNVGLASISVTGTVVRHFEPRYTNNFRKHDRWVVTSEILKRIPSRDNFSNAD